MDYIAHVHNMFSVEDNDKLGQPISRAGLTDILKECAKEKSPGSNGWGVELFLHYIELMIPDLLAGSRRIKDIRIHIGGHKCHVHCADTEEGESKYHC